MRYRRKKRKSIDVFLNNTLLFLLAAAAVISVVLVGDYIGFVSYRADTAGKIVEVNIIQRQPAVYWNGAYGIVIGAIRLNNTWFFTATNAGMTSMNLIVPCLEPGIEHEVYASEVPASEISWADVVAATPEMFDNWLGISEDNILSSNKTFTYLITVEVGNKTITNVPAAYTLRYNEPNSRKFAHGLLTDGTHLIVVAKMVDEYIVGFNPNTGPINYQMFVPVRANSTQAYYMYTDPNDICPQGAEGGKGEGSVYGWVTDNQTGVFLENVDVYVGNRYATTDSTGYFNLSVEAGSYKIIAMKTGYINYVGNVTVIKDNSTMHNLSLQQYQPPQPGTGPGVGTGVDVGPGKNNNEGPGQSIGPGIGPGIGPYVEKPEQYGIDHFISLDKLVKKLRIGNFFVENLIVFNFRKDSAKVHLEITGNASKIIMLDKTDFVVEQNKFENITITGFGSELGVFTGELKVSGDFNDSLPIMITVTDEDKLPIEALLMELEVITGRPYAGNRFKYKINLHNMLTEEKYNVSLYYYIRGVETNTANYSMYVGNDTVPLLTSVSVIKEITLPKNWQKGDYYLTVDAYYLDLNSQTSTIFTIYEPLYMYSVLGVMPLWQLLAILIGLSVLILSFILIRARIESKKRFHAKVEYNLLPKKGPRSIYIGKIAETEKDTFIDMDKLTVHSIIAGSTGGGKSISAQVIIEECLLKGVSVVVFDPTAQWSGMLRKCTDEKMLSFYPRFGLTKKDARAFSGNIRAIKDPREKIDLSKYWKPGEIQVFTTSTLDPKGMDIFVANTVREVFHSNLQEYRGLRMLMVYDEVHRLLPKFGGSGEGFIQIERACREFRKWGIGVVLISQVLADFVGQIKANINTEIQMKTRDEGDLARIETKYGKGYIQGLVKAPVGSGMLQNSEWNRGQPYYITFRPILHSVQRLTDQELEQYNKFNEIVDDLEFQLEQLEKEGIDVFDLKLELKLSRDKIKSGNFNMVDIYLEGLKPRIEKHWKDLGKTPKKRTLEVVSQDEINAEMNAAKQSRDQYDKEHPGEKKEEKKESGPLGFKEDVPPDKILNLVNGMLVINMKSLYDEVSAMKPGDFAQHVNEKKNDFAAWIRNAIKNNEWADMADQIVTKEDFIKFLEMAEQGKAKDFKPVTPKPKPEEKNDAKKDGKAETAFTKAVEPAKILKLEDSTEVKSLSELCEKLKGMSPESYSKHVTAEKNDFADWVKDAVKDEELSGKMKTAKQKEEMVAALESRK